METLYTLQQRNIAQSQTLQAGSGRPVTPLDAARANDIFDHFLNASTLKSILGHYRLICDLLHLRPSTLPNFYPKLKQHLTSWRAKAVWKKFDARANNKVYGKGRVCPETRVLIIGAGPCGLRTAIEAQMLGAKVVVLEKRDRMSRNNVLHLWPFVIDDLRSLGAKKFFGKFCAGSIDHISIRQLQCILLKVALLLGIEIHTEVSYESLVEPSIENKRGWRAQVKPTDHPVSQYEFDVIIGADGKRNTLQGFKRKEFRGKLAIAITANFINRRTEAEARVEEISGVAFIFNQKFFKDLYAETQIDLENIVYYKDDTHYFVMTAKKHSLLSKSVIRSDQTDTARLLSPDNVDRTALMAYAREAAEFSTGRQMLDLEFAVNHYGQPDVAMFDFTSMYAAENASRIVDREGYRLLCILVGDSLLEPFWPTGSGCARGFLSSLDAAWAIRAWGSAVPPLSVLAERESIYRLLGGTTPENLHRDSKSYSLDPSSRYPKLNRQVLSSHQVIGLYDTDDVAALKAQTQKEEEVVEVQHQHGSGVIKETAKKRRKIDEEDLLSWIKKQVVDYNLPVPNLSENTFNDGKILCAILHHYRPDLVDYKDLPEDNALCCHIAIELLEKEIGISSIIAPSEMATMECTRQQLISYLSQIYETFKREIAHINHPKMIFPPEKNPSKKNHSTTLKFPIPKKCIKKELVTSHHDKNFKQKLIEHKKTEKKTFSANFHKNPTILEKIDLKLIEQNKNTAIATYAKQIEHENFKSKLLFHSDFLIKNETNIATNFIKVCSVSDYLLIVPKTFSSLVKYFSDTTANATKFNDIATLDHCEREDATSKDIELKRGQAYCNILLEQRKNKPFLVENDFFDSNVTGSDYNFVCKFGLNAKNHINSNKKDCFMDLNKTIAANRCCMRIEIKNNSGAKKTPCENTNKNDLNINKLANLQNFELISSNQFEIHDKLSQQHENINLLTLSTENQVCTNCCQSTVNTLSNSNNNAIKATNVDDAKQCQDDRAVKQSASNGAKPEKHPNRHTIKSIGHLVKFRNAGVISKVLKYGAGKHTMHKVHNNNSAGAASLTSNPNRRTCNVPATGARSTVSDRIRTWLHTNDFDGGGSSFVGTSTIVNYNGNMAANGRMVKGQRGGGHCHQRQYPVVEDELRQVEELIGQQSHLVGDNCTDITGLTSVTKSPPLWGCSGGGGGRIVVDRGERRGDVGGGVIRFGQDGEPIQQQQQNREKLKLPSKTCSGNQSYATTNSNHSNTSAKHKLFASNKNMLSTTPLPKLYHSPTRNDEDNVQKLYRTNNQPASPLNKSSPNVLTNNKLSSVFDNKQELQLNKIKLPQQQPQENNKVDDHRIKVLDVDEELDEESNNSMEELTARLMDRFRGVVSSGAGGGGGLNATLGDGGGGGKVRVIQTISNPFSAITEKDDDDDDDDDEVTTDMPELKQHTLNALTGATNTTIVPTESPMHHRNFAGLRATPPHHHQLTQTKPNHHHYNHHHIRQAIPLAVTGNNVSASGGGVGAASTVAGSSVATGRSRKRKSAAPAGGGGAGRGDADGVGLVWWTFMWVVLEAGVAGFTLFALDLYANGDKYGVATSPVSNSWFGL